ncbi:hypothetical protein BDD12DRAFT_855524 [Trichophaea hybrida]|nr:hypothetical protein BDD12DRAFT_855524 [Trichophaea hybrida]
MGGFAPEGPLLGDFNLGVLEGLMRFCRDDESWSDFESDTENWDLGSSTHIGGKRKGSQLKNHRHKRQRIRRQGEAFNDRILHFIWRGRETGYGTIEVDYTGSHTGYIQFSDDQFTRFEGVLYGCDVDPIAECCRFEGFKVQDEVERTAKTWDEYTKERFVYQSKASRWRVNA